MPYLRIITPSFPPETPPEEQRRLSEAFVQQMQAWGGQGDLNIIAGTPIDVKEVPLSATEQTMWCFLPAPSGVSA